MTACSDWSSSPESGGRRVVLPAEKCPVVHLGG